MNSIDSLTPEEVLELERQVYQHSLYEFVKAAWHILEPATPLILGWHIAAICQRLEAVTRGDITKLAISIPPGFMKSNLVSVMWPAWEWTHSPHIRFVSTGASETFIERDCAYMRRIIASDWYQQRWPMSFPHEDTKLKFENDSTGFRWGRSFTNLTGARGNRFIYDDLLMVTDGESEIKREAVNKAFFESTPSRGSMLETTVIIMQRVHEKDLIGELKRRMAEGQKLHFSFFTVPFEYEPIDDNCGFGGTDPRTEMGELLLPAYKSAEWAASAKDMMGPYAWSAQYQQDPVPRGNGLFKHDDFKRYRPEDLPKHLNHYVTSDHANGGKDYNVIRVWAVDDKKRFWLVDSFRERCSINAALGIKASDDGRLMVADQGALALVRKYRPLCWYAEPDPLFKANYEMLRNVMRSSGVSCRVEFATGHGNKKVEKSSAYQSLSQLGMIYLPETAVGDAALLEYCAFPAGRHDDQVDADSILPRMTSHAAFIAPDDPGWRDRGDYIVRGDDFGDDTPTSNSF